MTVLQPGPTNSLTDVAGIRVGHADRRGADWLSRTTAVFAPEGGAVAAVDVRAQPCLRHLRKQPRRTLQPMEPER